MKNEFSDIFIRILRSCLFDDGSRLSSGQLAQVDNQDTDNQVDNQDADNQVDNQNTANARY